MKKSAILFLAVTLLGCGHPEDNSPVTLRFNPKDGAQYLYLVRSISSQGDGVYEMLVKRTAKRGKTGPIAIITEVTSFKLNGKEMIPAKISDLSSMTSLNDSGKMLAFDGISGKQVFLTPEFTDKPIKPGDTWQADFHLQATTLPTTYKFVGYDDQDGVHAVHIETNVTPQITLRFEGPLEMWVDPRDGMLVRYEMHTSDPSHPGATASQTITRAKG